LIGLAGVLFVLRLPESQVAYTFTAENFPTRLRTRGYALADGGGHLGGLWAPSCYPH
jgi:hypothetical protein